MKQCNYAQCRERRAATHAVSRTTEPLHSRASLPSNLPLVDLLLLILWPPFGLVGVSMPAPATMILEIPSKYHTLPQYHTKSVSQRCYCTPATALLWPLGTAPRPCSLCLQACLVPFPVPSLFCLLFVAPRVLNYGPPLGEMPTHATSPSDIKR